MKNILVRASSGAIYVGLFVGAILGGSPWFLLWCSLLAVMAISEYDRLNITAPRNIAAILALMADISAASVMIWASYFGANGEVGMFLPPIYLLLRCTLAIFDSRKAAFMATAHSFTSLFYGAMPLAMLAYIYNTDFHIGMSSHWLILNVLIMIWLNDTGAYCAGTLLGRHKMAPRLSPKKSWEGLVGGLVFCIGWGIAAAFITDSFLSPPMWIALGAIVCMAATLGDLFESLLKRNLGVKDSGNMIPGHGGILDRIDSLLFVAPTLLLFLLAIR